jgi:UDP-3-O-[3-hydroxymyristoyl] N-acetylglucosamine deacetylase
MDGMIADRGMAAALGSHIDPLRQATLASTIGCAGVGVHSGRRISLTLSPAPANTGILFRRTDTGEDIAGLWHNVIDTRLCTVLGDPARPGARVATVEHLMAAFVAAGIDNALVELDGPEIPIQDGSAEPFLFLMDCAGRAELPALRQLFDVQQTIRVESADGFAELRPLGAARSGPCLDAAISIDFTAPAIGRQALTLALTPAMIRRDLVAARTFALAAEVAQLQAAGLALGGSLDNAIVVDHARVLNPLGLRAPDEFVRHKLLDAVGDLALAGGALRARYVAHRPGHALNNRLLRALFAAPAALRPAQRLDAIAA